MAGSETDTQQETGTAAKTKPTGKPKGRKFENDLEELKKSLTETTSVIHEMDPIIDSMIHDLGLPETKGGKPQKSVFYEGWTIMMKYMKHRMRMDEVHIRSQIALTHRVDHLEKRLTAEINEVRDMASKQAVINPSSYASVLASSTANNAGAEPAPATQPHYTVVDKRVIQKKQTKEAEKCSRQVVMDVCKLADIEDPTARTQDELTKVIITSLQSIDKEIDIEKDLREFRPMDKHAEKPYLIEFNNSNAVDRLLEAAKKIKVGYKHLRPSRTREQRETLRVAREQQPKDADGNPISKSRTWEERRRERNKGRVFFNPKPQAAAEPTSNGTAAATDLSSK